MQQALLAYLVLLELLAFQAPLVQPALEQLEQQVLRASTVRPEPLVLLAFQAPLVRQA